METLQNQLRMMQANAGDQVNQLQAEIERLKAEHADSMQKLQSDFEQQQSNLISDHNIQMANNTREYEEKLGDLAQQKDS